VKPRQPRSRDHLHPTTALENEERAIPKRLRREPARYGIGFAARAVRLSGGGGESAISGCISAGQSQDRRIRAGRRLGRRSFTRQRSLVRNPVAPTAYQWQAAMVDVFDERPVACRCRASRHRSGVARVTDRCARSTTDSTDDSTCDQERRLRAGNATGIGSASVRADPCAPNGGCEPCSGCVAAAQVGGRAARICSRRISAWPAWWASSRRTWSCSAHTGRGPLPSTMASLGRAASARRETSHRSR
jgi:hypothetical protein